MNVAYNSENQTLHIATIPLLEVGQTLTLPIQYAHETEIIGNWGVRPTESPEWSPVVVRRVDGNYVRFCTSGAAFVFAPIEADGVVNLRNLTFGEDEVFTVTETAEVAQTSVQAVRDVLRDDARRAAIFPGAYRTSDHPQRGEWRIPRAEVEAWQPKRVNREE